jgi:hypothetical protein
MLRLPKKLLQRQETDSASEEEQQRIISMYHRNLVLVRLKLISRGKGAGA